MLLPPSEVIILFIGSHHWSIPWSRLMQSSPSPLVQIHFNIILSCSPASRKCSCVWLIGLNLCMPFFVSPMRATAPAVVQFLYPDQPNDIWRRINVLTFLIVQFSPPCSCSCSCFLPSRSTLYIRGSCKCWCGWWSDLRAQKSTCVFHKMQGISRLAELPSEVRRVIKYNFVITEVFKIKLS
jgi:hypothetical protein